VVAPNTAGLVARGAFSKTMLQAPPNNLPGPGQYTAVSAATTTITINTSGLYYVTGNLSLSDGSAQLTVANGVNAVLLVDGNVTFNGKVNLTGSAQLSVFCNKPANINNNVNSSGSTSNFMLLGTPNCTQINVTGNSTVVGSIFAPQAAVVMQTSAPKLYGAVIANSLTMKNGAQLHFDEALRTLRLSCVTGGSAPPGTADYLVTITGGPGLH
jgi:hypothetical protein